MRIAASAPGRVNLIGEHTDYNGGLVLPMAINRRTEVVADVRGDQTFSLRSTHLDECVEFTIADLTASMDRLPTWARYGAGTLWALDQDGVAIPGLDLTVSTTVPLGAGLSSSASFELAVGAAALHAASLRLDNDGRDMLVRAGIRAENDAVGAPTGGMDQTVVAHARAGYALLIDFADRTRTPVPVAIDPQVVLVTDTGAHHSLADGGYGNRRSECERAAAALGVATLSQATLQAAESLPDDVLRRRARHVITENHRVREAVAALGSGDLDALGRAWVASHRSLAADFEVSCAELDTAVAAALSAGAVGARMTGGGFGGSIVSLVPKDSVERVSSAIDAAFDARGWDPADHFAVEPSHGVTSQVL
ncbi:MAG: galactokinase [Nocardioides sp.]